MTGFSLSALLIGLRRAAATFLALTGGHDVPAAETPMEKTFRRVLVIGTVGCAFCSGLLLGCAF